MKGGILLVPVYKAVDLRRVGLRVNLHMYLGDGWLYCVICARDTHHYTMSHPGQADCWEICDKCDNYAGRFRIKELE